MEHTPRTVNQAHRRAHLGTPKASSSKKSLFGKDAEDEADIGPMTPLRFGSHRRKGQTPNNALTNITSFRNLFGNESPDSDRSLSPDFARRYTNNGRYELLSADHDKENLAQAVVDEETRFSFGSSSIPETPTSSRLSAEESALLDENNSNSLSILMTSDLNLVERGSKVLHRTPGVTTRSRSTAKLQASPAEPLLRRTQQLQGVKRTHNGTPDNSSQSPAYAKEGSSIAKRPNVKARTALHFNDVQPIPAKSFYSSSSTTEKESPVKALQPLPTKSFYSSTTALSRAGNEGHIVTPHHKSPDNLKPLTHNTATSKQVSKTPHKTYPRKRSKSFSSTAPRLGQRGTVHKIRKPSKKPSPKVNESHKAKRRSQRQQQKNNRAIAGDTKSCPTTPKSTVEQEPDREEMLLKLRRVNSILREGQKNLNMARPLITSRSMTDLSCAALSGGEEACSSSSEEDDESASDGDEGGTTTQRKFFRSKRRSRSIRSVYKHFDTITVGVQNGGKRKLLNFPQPPKRRRTLFGEESFDFESEQLEVNDLISKLIGDGSFVDETEEQPQNSGDSRAPGQNQVNDEDAPIPIQTNVIYLTAGDELEVNERNPSEETMEHQQSDCENGEMIIVQHDAVQEDAYPGAYDADAVLEEAYPSTSDDYEYFPSGYASTPSFDQPPDHITSHNRTIIIQHDTSSMIYHNDSTMSSTVVQNTVVSQYQCQTQCLTYQVPQTTMPDNPPSTNGYYPIFYPDRLKELWRHEQQQAAAVEQQTTEVSHLLRQQNARTKSTDKHKQRHAGVGQNQYQIDAGQRVYGAVYCKECGLTYSTHEPEEELFHDNFHRAQAKLTIPSGLNEQVVVQVPEWDVTGRIIVVSQADSSRQQLLNKVQSVLEMVDSELGYATQGELPEGSCVYLAIARSTVLGICVVQPLQYANRMICLDGLHGIPIDCYSSEFYPAKCGISRIWVAPKYRRKGIGRKLMSSVRYHYIFGYAMKPDEIAFGAPTEMGKLFAEAICGRKDFLVYV